MAGLGRIGGRLANLQSAVNMALLTRKRPLRTLLTAIGLTVVAVAVAACGGHATGANDNHFTGTELHATGANDNHSTGAVLHATGGCGSGKSCHRYFRYRKAGTDGWQSTSVVAPTAGPNGNLDAHQTVSGLQHDTSYEYQVCGPAKVQNHGCVGPDGTTNTMQTFRTAIWTADATRSIDQEWAGYATGTNCGVVTNGQSDPWVFQSKDGTAPKGVVYRSVISQTGERPCYCSGSVACRSEIGQGLPSKTFSDGIDRTFHPGDDRWISFMVKLDSNYPLSGGIFNSVMQIKQNTSCASPAVGVQVSDGQWHIDQSTNNTCASGGVLHAVGTARAGVWVKWTLHIVFNSDPSKGAITAWSDLANPAGSMQEVFNENPTYTMKTGYDSHVRLGIYRDLNISGSTGVEYAGYTVASDRAASEGNAFSP